MKKYRVYIHAYAGASYDVEAESEAEAIEIARDMQHLDDCEVYEFSTSDEDVEELET